MKRLCVLVQPLWVLLTGLPPQRFSVEYSEQDLVTIPKMVVERISKLCVVETVLPSACIECKSMLILLLLKI